MAFDPDKYLSEKTSSNGGFNPDQYLAEKNNSPGVAAIGVTNGPTPAGEASVMDKVKNFGRSIADSDFVKKGVVEQLPELGAAAGGIVGGVGGTAIAPGPGSVAGALTGAGFGGSTGAALRNLLKSKLYGENVERKDLYSAPVTGAMTGLEQEMTGQNLGAAAKALSPYAMNILRPIGRGAAVAGETLTAVPRDVIQHYASPEGNAATKALMSSSGNDTAVAADMTRENTMDAIKNFRTQQNAIIDSELEKAAASGKRADLQPVINRLEAEKAKYNSNAQPEAISAIDSLIDRAKKFTAGEVNAPYSGAQDIRKGWGPAEFTPNEPVNGFGQADALPGRTPPVSQGAGRGVQQRMTPSQGTGGYGAPPKVFDATATPTDANRLKGVLQNLANSSYMDQGQIFAEGSAKSDAAKAAAAETRMALDKVSPEITAANKNLYDLHAIEERPAVKNLYTAGNNDASLRSAGAQSNQRNLLNLTDLQKLLGTDLTTPAKNLAAMEMMGKAPILPMDSTGKTLTRGVVGATMGSVISPGVGTVIGASAMSPKLWQMGIDTGLAGREAALESAPLLKRLTGAAYNPWVNKSVGDTVAPKINLYKGDSNGQEK